MSGAYYLGRPLPGVVGETRRMCHVFPAQTSVPTRFVALCGVSFDREQLELLDGPRGMPCEPCLRSVPRPRREVQLT